MFGVPGTDELSTVVSTTTTPDIPCPQVEASDLEDAMTGATSLGTPVHASIAISNLERLVTDESSEPMAHTVVAEFPEPLPMELLKIPIANHFSS